MKAISIRQPWAWLIVNAGKDIENRSWWTPLRGPVFIHASKGCTQDEYEEARMFAAGIVPFELWETMPGWKDIERGGIIGRADIVGCVKKSYSPWFFGPNGFVLRNQMRLPFFECKGQLGFFDVEILEGIELIQT
ncbi:MAG: ASCH domain-containing protein [Candidatus Omnitrophica bacterium]|jgi:hypothetical protein|nr:ASCH domain-containing protein [Candidatus Omnitrophota bacterium]